jgi:hypothetical protein
MRAALVSRHVTAVILALAVPLAPLNSVWAQTPAAPQMPPAPATPAPAANRILEGKILDEEGKAIEKAVVKVRNLETGEEYTSPPTGANGAYKFNRLPPGRYEIAVQTERGVYLGNRVVDLVHREAQTYSFSLRNVPAEQALEQARAARGATDEERAKGGRPAITPSEKAEREKGFWRNPVSATLAGLAIAIGAAVIVDEARDEDDDDDASPSGP